MLYPIMGISLKGFKLEHAAHLSRYQGYDAARDGMLFCQDLNRVTITNEIGGRVYVGYS
jgi:hypothetical protein